MSNSLPGQTSGSHLPNIAGTTEDPEAVGVLGTNTKGGTAILGASGEILARLPGRQRPSFSSARRRLWRKRSAGGHWTRSHLDHNSTGVFGDSAGEGFGVRGESHEGIAIQGRSFSGNRGLAGRFIGNVHIQGNPGSSSGDLRVEGTTSFVVLYLRWICSDENRRESDGGC